MRQIFMITAIILAFSVAYGYGQMHEGGHMMGQGTTDIQQGQVAAPGYGMMGQGYGGHMMGGMKGSGGHMMGSGGHMGCGGHMMGGILGDGTEEEQKKFLDDTADLRKEMHNKKFEYAEAQRKTDTKRATLLKLKKEMLEIKIKMYDKAIKNN